MISQFLQASAPRIISFPQGIQSWTGAIAGILFLSGMASVPSFAYADDEKPELTPEAILKREGEKSGFTLFNRTHEGLVRELTPDRPDKTESPYSVDAGHFQIEADFVNFTRTTLNASSSTEALYGNFLAKAGLNRTMDLQFGFSPLAVTQVGGGGSQTGMTDLTVRLKWNLMGNEGGDFAFGLLPFVSLPTSGQGTKIAGGLSLPTGYSLPFGFEGGAMATVTLDPATEVGASGYFASLSTMATFGHDIVGPVGGYVEFFNTLPQFKTEGWVATLDLGLTYGVNPHLQFDAGVNLGVTDASDAVNAFTGVTARF